MTSLLLFFSGFASLVYQVLWLRDLSVLFGSSAQAAAVDLAVFFAGLALGSAVWGRLAPRLRNPLATYGLLELGIAAAALLFFAMLTAYGSIYVPLHQQLRESAFLLGTAKALLAFGVLALPTTLMGGTLPVMVQHHVRGARALGRSGAWLYGVNTAGATMGAFCAGFFLPPLAGFRGSYLLALGINVAVGVAALVASRRGARVPAAADLVAAGPAPAPRRARSRSVPRAHSTSAALAPRVVQLVAFASGALTLGLEIAWLRMFAQVLDNSIYAFSAVIVVVLVALALASLAVSRLEMNPVRALALLPAVSALLVAVQPPLFVAMTDNLASISSDGGWIAYVARVFALTAAFAGLPSFVAGMVFPLVLRVPGADLSPGRSVGRLLFVNTAGAIAGSLVTSFVLLPAIGVWLTVQVIAAAYVATGAVVAGAAALRRRGAALVWVSAAAVLLAAMVASDLPRVRLDAARGERVLQLWEGSHGIVAVTERTDGRLLRMNNSYALGGTVDRIERERIQTFIPLTLHPSPRRVFFIGLGTGITAGEALRHPVERVVVSELVPEVVRASRDYFADWTGALARDPRVDIRVEDGRQFLMTTGERFDVVVSDLFVPWHAGTGSLYTREHFETVRARLAPGGVFAQWLPLFQLSEHNFQVIARTLMQVFPHVVVWRGDFYANRPIAALVASTEPLTLDLSAARARAGDLAGDLAPALLPFYAGNIGAAGALLGDGPVNTDERPVIEYLSPISQWSNSGADWFVGAAFATFVERLQRAVPPGRDPYLSLLTAEERRHVEAGSHYYRAIVQRVRGEDAPAKRSLERALEHIPERIRIGGPFMGLEPFVTH